MRKVLSILLSASLLFGIGTSALAAEVKDQKAIKAYDLIEKTNEKIEEEILKAKEKADKLREEYLEDVYKLEKQGKVDFNEEVYLTRSLEEENEEKIQEIDEKLSNIDVILVSEEMNSDEKLLLVEEEVNEIQTILPSDETAMTCPRHDRTYGNTIYDQYNERTDKYLRQLCDVITNLQDKAEKMTADTINKVAEVNITAVCVYVPVQMGHLWVLVDPIRVVGRN